MPRSQNISVQNSFARGFLTETTDLTFPENAVTDQDNCEFSRIGPVTRRLGFDLEPHYSTYVADVVGNCLVSYLWADAAGRGDISFVVVQVGNNLHFYKGATDASLSASKHSTIIDLTTYMPSGITSVATLECQFSTGNGLLFVTNPKLESFYVTYDADLDTLTGTQITLQQRDFLGDVTDALAVDTRPTMGVAGLSAAHKYNLLNQGWTTANLTAWDTARTDMPSNADVNWYFKDASDNFAFSTTVDNRAVGNSKAPRGHFIYNIYNITRSANVSGATDEATTTDRVSTSAFYAGRVFYAGIKSAGQNAKIFFSQIIQGKTEYGLCYQTNDPTSETLFNLLATDGGVINIPDAGTVYKMIPSLNSLVVFASNGIWAITGSQGIGFTANDYTISKVSSIRCISAANFIDVEGTPYWWNLDGIYTLTLDHQTNAMKILSVTDTTIKSFFETIPGESKQFARGAYDFFTKRLLWIYKSVGASSFEDKYVFDKVLVFSLISNAFYTWTLNTTNVRISSLVDVISSGGDFSALGIINGTNTVINGSDTVLTFGNTNSSVDSTMKFMVTYTTSGTTKLTFAENSKTTNRDWGSFDGVGQTYSSYFITGFKLHSQGMTKFQQNYINVFNDNELDTSFKINGLWDFATSGNTGRWSSTQLFNVSASDYSTRVKKIKIRGQGLVCQFKITSNGDDPFDIIGWSVFESGNKWP